jgi:peptidoglycan L-alanyl-D-glutamate endopeptidase CwlK
VPASAILVWRGDARLASFARSETYDTLPDGAVAALLRGEHLTPPASLPPAIFATREVELVRPRLAFASRKWDLLDDAFSQRLLRVYQLMKERYGYDMVLIEGYRSPERQNELAGMGSHVTRAAAYQSYHQYGLAADSAFIKDGRLVISEKDPWAMQGYRLFGELATEFGLTWGGHWTFRDFGHVEWRRRGR